MTALFKKGRYNHERESLVSGFVRLNSETLNVPDDLYQLCRSFYDDVTFWHLKDDKLRTFMDHEFQQKLLGPTFSNKGITFQLVAYPNGEWDGEEGFVQLYLKVLHHPPEMKTLHLYLTMFCEQNHYYFRYFENIFLFFRGLIRFQTTY